MQSFRCIINQPNHPSRVAARRSYRSPSVAPVDRKCCKTPPPTIINDPRLLTQSTFICAILRSNIEHGKAVSISSCIAAVDRTSWQLSRPLPEKRQNDVPNEAIQTRPASCWGLWDLRCFGNLWENGQTYPLNQTSHLYTGSLHLYFYLGTPQLNYK